MEWMEMTWSEIVNRYEDDNQSFEDYVCDQLYLEKQSFEELNARFEGKTLRIRPNYDYIKWHGTLNSDFTLAEFNERKESEPDNR